MFCSKLEELGGLFNEDFAGLVCFGRAPVSAAGLGAGEYLGREPVPEFVAFWEEFVDLG